MQCLESDPVPLPSLPREPEQGMSLLRLVFGPSLLAQPASHLEMPSRIGAGVGEREREQPPWSRW